MKKCKAKQNLVIDIFCKILLKDNNQMKRRNANKFVKCNVQKTDFVCSLYRQFLSSASVQSYRINIAEGTMTGKTRYKLPHSFPQQ